MNVRRFAIAATLAFACASASAREPDRAPVPSIDAIFSGLVQEQDVAAAFRYFRESLDAALDGRDPPPPPAALIQRAEVIGDELKRRGGAVARGVLDAIEAIVREQVREPARRPPPSSPMRGI
jgi:hypothetical protein